MKKPGAFIVLLSVFIITACDGGVYTSDYHYQPFEYRLQGMWETYNRFGIFFGSLIITYDKIIIEGYDVAFYYLNSVLYYADFNVPERPFGTLPRYFPLKGYSEKTDNNRGIIYIENPLDGVLNEIPYAYSSEYDSSLHEYVEKLLFAFPSPGAENSRPETLIRIAD